MAARTGFAEGERGQTAASGDLLQYVCNRLLWPCCQHRRSTEDVHQIDIATEALFRQGSP